MEDLPPELIDQVLFYLSDREYWTCQTASGRFHVSSKTEWTERKFLNSNFYKLLYHGNLDGVRYHIQKKTLLLVTPSLDKTLNNIIANVAETSEIVCSVVAFRGHIHILQELIRIGYPLSDNMGPVAVRGNQLEFLKYLHFLEYDGRGIAFQLTFYQNLAGIRWYHAVTDGTKFDGIDLHDFYDFRMKNYLQKRYHGKVYQW